MWVFKKIIKNDKDFVGLIAYSLYKRRKSDLAISYRKEGLDEAEIVSKLKIFHDQAVQGKGALDSYRERAEALLDDLLLDSHEAGRREAFECVLAEAKDSKAASTGKIEKFFKWLFSGVPSAVATIVLTAFVLGAFAMFASPAEKGKYASEVVNKAVGESVVQPVQPK